MLMVEELNSQLASPGVTALSGSAASSRQPVCANRMLEKMTGVRSTIAGFLPAHYHICCGHGLEHPQDPSGGRCCALWFWGRIIEGFDMES